MPQQTQEELELEIIELNNLVHGLDYYLNQGGYSQASKQILGPMSHWWQLVYQDDRSTPERKLLIIEELKVLIQEMKDEAMLFGVPADDIKDEELRRYNIQLESDMKNSSTELHGARKDGLPDIPKSFKLH